MSWLKSLGKRIIGGKNCCSDLDSGCCGPVTKTHEATKDAVRKNYADLIKAPHAGSCCGSGATVGQLAGYTAEQLGSAPEQMRETTFACGNPVAFAEMKEGEVVLDIGSGAGLDALLAAKKVGPEGKVIGLDITPEMIEAARANAVRAGATNIEFRLGDAEVMPVEEASCDWIISNCVINLAPDKGEVFREAFRVLKPGGRLMISDIVTHDLPSEIRSDMAAWVGCVGGALEEKEYLEKMRAAGFQDIKVVARLTYNEDSIKALAGGCCSPEAACGVESALAGLASRLAGRVSSVRVSAVKPLGKE